MRTNPPTPRRALPATAGAPVLAWLVLASLVLAVAACSGEGSAEPAERTATTATTATTAASSPTAASRGAMAAPVPVDVDAWIEPAPIPPSSASEPSGNFRVFCGISHVAADDPIVHPGQPGAAHLHVFFGNTAADASSTFESLRASGDGTCQGGPVNRTAYWMPAVLDPDGDVVEPDYVELYYKGNGTAEMIGAIATNPDGLRMIAGYDAADPAAVPAAWSCGGGEGTATIPSCPAGAEVRVAVRFPMCWDGHRVDAPDHRAHMAYGTGGGGWVTAQGGCPASHPVHLPELTLLAIFTSDGASQRWSLSSDHTDDGMLPPGSTFHADWFGAWDPVVQETWTQECIRELRNCDAGALGDGTRLRDV